MFQEEACASECGTSGTNSSTSIMTGSQDFSSERERFLVDPESVHVQYMVLKITETKLDEILSFATVGNMNIQQKFSFPSDENSIAFMGFMVVDNCPSSQVEFIIHQENDQVGFKHKPVICLNILF
jgi:hypothetical protein